MTWIEEAVAKDGNISLLVAYAEWVDDRIEMEPTEVPMRFAEWLEMEREIADPTYLRKGEGL
jgi:hypothetical protein